MIVKFNKLNIFYTKEGTGENCILFLHGWGCDGNTLSCIKDSLVDKYSCVSIDMPGFGKSDYPTSDYDVLDYASCIKHICEQLHINKVTIIGHSFGGRVAIVLASKYANFVSKLILIGSAGLKDKSLAKVFKVAKFKLLKLLVKLKILPKSVINSKGSNDYIATDDRLKGTFVKVVNQDLSKYAKRINCTTLLIYGSNDNATPMKMAKKLNKLIKNSQLVEIEDCGHFCFLEKTRLINKIVRCMVDYD